MRIREIYFRNVRSFRGEHRISFVDPLVDEVRPVTVIAGTNGTGKTTIFDTIEALLRFALEPGVARHPFLDEIDQTGAVCMTLELLPQSQSGSTRTLQLVVGSEELIPDAYKKAESNTINYASNAFPGQQDTMALRLQEILSTGSVESGLKAERALRGGLIYFPQTRQLFPHLNIPGGIQPEPAHSEWVSRVTPPDQWQGSLEALWVWQNYLDLEAGAYGEKTSYLKSFIESVEEILGEHRKITVKEGRAMVPAPWHQNGNGTPKVRLDQLPSGEQQCLLLFGELARRRRPGAVILIDEPETSLHPTMQRLVVHQLRKLAREWDSQLILATHSLEVLRAVHESQRLNLDQLEAQDSQIKEPA
ncbi:MAG TPA: ATP-binding protein [Blastocatellia bacterium]|nr:ATP-binding protein [Blastocatellia bacterium]